MIRRKGKMSAMILGFLALFVLFFGLKPNPVLAKGSGGGTSDPCYNQADSDQDGFCDVLEGTNVNVCGQPFQLDPNKKDVFVLLIPASGGYIQGQGFDPFGIAKAALPMVNIHVLTPNNTCNATWTRDIPIPNSSLFFSQKALRIQEDLSPSVIEVGNSTPGLPSGRDDAKVFTTRIWQKIIDACPFLGSAATPSLYTCSEADCDKCQVNSNITGMNIFSYYIQSTIAHEMGHMLHPLAQPYSRKIEYHDPANSGYIMDQFYIATTKSGVITIPVSDHYKQPDVDLVDFGSLMP